MLSLPDIMTGKFYKWQIIHNILCLQIAVNFLVFVVKFQKGVLHLKWKILNKIISECNDFLLTEREGRSGEYHPEGSEVPAQKQPRASISQYG